ncbi:MAG: preprotein translocase subunit SecE [Chloroflexi bacterium]|nr:MAG: preprotein translocase subunit SecE [Chloroflexota bacterium]TMC27178.1 MAG: preprotein translocase subunit SecE [Chloroflexota bacterium]TMC34208.1 MAG: preprotein translocase subunit SecE [Chloroflexota bacterium]TMC57239.1 MAG: preprotein translocase subunit SecE [Chloroflexota bacterium]TME36392.1 MAG: preprotein translocase subunit SecE [Chloroflexota bacterium]
MAQAPAIPRGTGVVAFAQECWAELQKVTWPERQTIVRLTLIVIVISVLVAVYIFLFDNLFTIVVTQQIVGAPGASPTPAP